MAQVLPFRVQGERVTPKGVSVALAATLELNSAAFPTHDGMLMLLQTWLVLAERDGVTTRHPEYAEALERAIKAVNASPTVPDAIALLRIQESRR